MARLLPPLVVVLALALPATAAAQGSAVSTSAVEQAVDALRTGPVYVDEDAEAALSASEAAQLRRRIASAATPVRVAVLPESALEATGGDPQALVTGLARAVGRDGTYGIIIGRKLYAISNTVTGTGGLARLAAAANRGQGSAAVLGDFVDRVEQRASGVGGGGGEPAGDGIPGGGLLALLALGAGLIGLTAFRRRRRERAELEQVKDTARDDLVALGEGIRFLDIDMEMPDASPEAKAHYERAIGAYDRANALFERARRPEDLEGFSAEVEDGRYAITAARAIAEGRPAPERRPPCFFDPRHGPSDRDVEWAPPGGAPRLVPACEADALRVEEGLDPATREVMVGGRAVPYWNAGPAYAPWAGGFFGGMGGGLFPGLLGGLMLGSMFGAMSPDTAYGQDLGGGDFGGGDFGGFGGGDFGGGFGGGDF